jgi:hypothetical protein
LKGICSVVLNGRIIHAIGNQGGSIKQRSSDGLKRRTLCSDTQHTNFAMPSKWNYKKMSRTKKNGLEE